MAAGAADKAILAFERAIAIRPQNGDALRYTGHLLTAAGRPLEGLDYLRRAATYEPRSALGHAFLAKAYAAAKSAEEAALAAATAVRLSEGNPVVLRIAGRAVLDAGRANEADRYLSAAARGAQDNPAVLTDLGHARAARALTNEAAQLYRRALELAPNYAEARVALRRLGSR